MELYDSLREISALVLAERVTILVMLIWVSFLIFSYHAVRIAVALLLIALLALSLLLDGQLLLLEVVKGVIKA